MGVALKGVEYTHKDGGALQILTEACSLTSTCIRRSVRRVVLMAVVPRTLPWTACLHFTTTATPTQPTP